MGVSGITRHMVAYGVKWQKKYSRCGGRNDKKKKKGKIDALIENEKREGKKMCRIEKFVEEEKKRYVGYNELKLCILDTNNRAIL